MRRALALLVAFLVLIALLWFARPRLASTPVAQEAPAAKPAEPQAAVLESAPLEAEASRVEAPAEPAREAPAAAPPEAAPPKLAELHGRIVLDGGAPAAGAKLSFSGAVGNNEREMKHGKPKEWPALSAECDADGRFALRFDPPRAYQFFLEASYPGCVTAHWRWSEIEPATTKDLGETLLPRAGAVAGRLLDAQGQPTRDDWRVYADAMGISKGDGSDSSRASAPVEKETGEFRLEGLPPGRVELKAYSQLASWIEGPKVEVRAGETTQADIRYAGPDSSARITVNPSTRPFHRFAFDVSGIALSAPGVETRQAQKIQRSSQSWSFEDVAPGSYTVTVQDPRFKPWSQEGVRPGQRITAKLVGAGSVSLAVVDAATRKPVARYALRARFDDANWSPNQFEVFGAEQDPPAAGLVEGLIPQDQTLIVVAEGYAPCELRLAGLKAGEVRPLTAELRPGTTLVARVLEADGRTPIAGLTVTLEPSRADEDPRRSRTIVMGANQREASSAADGGASFAAVAAGRYKLRAEVTPQLAAELDGVTVAESDTRKDVDLVLPPNGWLVGRVLGLEPGQAEGCYLAIVPVDLEPTEKATMNARAHFDKRGPRNLVAADGTFRAGPLRAGKSSVVFQFPSAKVSQGPNSSWTQPGASIDLGEVEIPAGGEEKREFDLSGRLPGRVEASVRLNGAPAAHARVSARSADQTRREGVFDLDAEGRGTSAPIAPGPVIFDVSSPDGDWTWTAPGIFTIASSETLRVEWDIALAIGTLEVVDEATGQPLAEKELSISLEVEAGGIANWVQRTTDKQGKVELRLAPGAYKLAFLWERGADGKPKASIYGEARFDWTAKGPVQGQVKVPKKP